MEFEWDEDKRKKNIEKHGVDFLDAALMFEGAVLSRIDDRQDYGEVREISLGMVDNVIYCVTHTKRDNRTRIISAWKGGAKEHEQYKKGIP
ncbi:BrnT family toxin [uncultured Roseobacter sp.]|uniref:BrnT family toxin n=1 Tax=uncultured Roseobacter sp. TaxID=114847 RepID=UPI00260900F5|nr:BrnT family toxin [uncultured Roseobacter sp.]